MKTVHASDMVAHLWANQSQEHASNATRSFWFNRAVLYSYRTPIAMMHDTRRGRVVLVTSDGYSVTTKSKHLNAMWRATQSHGLAFRVPYVGATGGKSPSLGNGIRAESWPLECAANVEHLVDEYRKLCGTLKRAFSIYESEAALAARLESEAGIVRSYCDAFALACPELDPADDARVIWRTHELRSERNADPKTAAKREAARVAREALKAHKQAEQRAAEYARETEARANFRAGIARYSYSSVRDERGGALLRYDAADDTVRTSLGAECPASHARSAFELIARCKRLGTTWEAHGLAGVKLGSFALHSIAADGTIRAGCHTIYWPEIEACARALGLDIKE